MPRTILAALFLVLTIAAGCNSDGPVSTAGDPVICPTSFDRFAYVDQPGVITVTKVVDASGEPATIEFPAPCGQDANSTASCPVGVGTQLDFWCFSDDLHPCLVYLPDGSTTGFAPETVGCDRVVTFEAGTYAITGAVQ